MSGLFNGIGDILGGIVNTVENTVEGIINNPIGAIVSVAAMEMGIPPEFAGALGGGANAASHGGNILEGAIVGGISGYAGAGA